MIPSLAQRLAADADQRQSRGLVRRRQVVEPDGPGLRVRVNGRLLINFSSNDYLGLAHDQAKASIHSAQFAYGAAASPLVTGYTAVHRELEDALAEFTGFESVCLFPSGYQANLAVGQALGRRGRSALADRLNHASLNDGLRLSGTRLVRYAHADADNARQQRRPDCDLIVTDTVFSMDGDLVPLNALHVLSRATDTALWIDDAHGFGVLGQRGRGALEHLGLTPDAVDVYVATFGKALGTAGAFVAGDKALIEHLENSARGLIYSTALSPAIAELTLGNLTRLRGEPERRSRLADNIERFRAACLDRDVPLRDSATAIQIVPIGDNQQAMQLSDQLANAGFLVKAIRPPTVPTGTARLRITLSSAHQPQAIDSLCDALAHLIPTSAIEPQ